MSLMINDFGNCCGTRVLFGFNYPQNFKTVEEFLKFQKKELQRAQKELYEYQYNYSCILNNTQYEVLKDLMIEQGFELVNVSRNSERRGGKHLYTYFFTHNKANDEELSEAGFPV